MPWHPATAAPLLCPGTHPTAPTLRSPARPPCSTPCWIASRHSCGCCRLRACLAACARANCSTASASPSASSLSVRYSDWMRARLPSVQHKEARTRTRTRVGQCSAGSRAYAGGARPQQGTRRQATCQPSASTAACTCNVQRQRLGRLQQLRRRHHGIHQAQLGGGAVLDGRAASEQETGNEGAARERGSGAHRSRMRGSGWAQDKAGDKAVPGSPGRHALPTQRVCTWSASSAPPSAGPPRAAGAACRQSPE